MVLEISDTGRIGLDQTNRLKMNWIGLENRLFLALERQFRLENGGCRGFVGILAEGAAL